MLKRTMILLSLTITVGVLLLVVGCGGSNNTAPFGSDIQGPPVSRQENLPPNSPYLWFPWEGWTILGGKISFYFVATDPNGDMLKYRLEVLQKGNVVRVLDQRESTQGWSKPAYKSGEWACVTVNLPVGDYECRVKAIDDKGAEGQFNNPVRTFKMR